MTTRALGGILNNMYNKPEANKVTMIFLFGIKYAKEIKAAARNSSMNSVVKEIVAHSNVPSSYSTEIKKAVILADYVDIKTSI